MRNDVPHLLVYISGHGFGHAAQVAPVLNRVLSQLPYLRLTICSKVPLQQLQSRIQGSFAYIDDAADFGMVMASALDVLPEASLNAYQEFHADWSLRLTREAQRIAGLAPDFVLTNVAYLPLAAAKQAQIPSAAMCSLNWADIFAAYCGAKPGARKILQEMRLAYAAADAFIRITPSMPMSDFANARVVDPIADVGRNRRVLLNTELGLRDTEKLVLVSMGGIAMRLPMERWPVMPNVRWIVQDDWEISRPDVVSLASLQMDFIDVMASSDAMLCKPGYGSFAEAACNGIPVIYVAREDWPEEPHLIAWMETNALCRRLSRLQSVSGEFGGQLQELLTLPKPHPVEPSGIAEAADYLLQRLN